MERGSQWRINSRDVRMQFRTLVKIIQQTIENDVKLESIAIDWIPERRR